jgi:hypothetical protein
VIQPEVILWVEMPGGLVVGSRIIDPREPASFEATFSEAMKQPAKGSPRNPARVRVPDQQLANALRNAVPAGTSVVVGPVPELDAVFADLVQSMPARLDPLPTYLGDGAISPAIVASLFSAASVLFRTAPWRHVGEEQVLRVDIPDLQVEAACLSVIGGAGESLGLLLFRSIDAYATFASGMALAEDETGRPARLPPEAQLLSLSFDRRKDLPPEMRREVERHRWEVAGAKAYPTVMVLADDGRPHQPAERDYRILTACANAFLAFFARHRDLFDADDPEVVRESFTGDDDVTVTVTAPYGSESTGALLERFFDFDENMPVDRVPVRPDVGRNDPCPCGSGKKYKKCHLSAAEEARAGAPSPHENVHEMDARLVREIGRFASRTFGPVWLGRGTEELGNDAVSLQLFLPWVAWTATADGKRVAQHYAEQNAGRLSDEERAWIDAQRGAWLSVWEVTSVEPGIVGVRDLLTGEKRIVAEVAGSRSLVARDTLLARVIDFRGTSLFGGFYARALPPAAAVEVVRATRTKARAGKNPVAIERLQDPSLGRFLIDRWRDAVEAFDERAAIPPTLQNTDGDPLLLVTDSFTFDPAVRNEIEARLTAMDGVNDVQRTDGETEVVFIKPGNRLHRSWENTVIGRVIVGRGSLQVESNSERRADALGRRVRDACAGLLRNGGRKAENPASKVRTGERTPKPHDMSPEEEVLLREAKEVHFREWIDTPIPALGGKTPRSAARAKASREKLDLMLRDLENRESRLPAGARFDIGRLRRELGLDPAT